MRRVAALVLLSGVLCLAQGGPPPARIDPVVETLYGQTVTDPYRWMEKSDSPELLAWMKAQNAYTHSILDRIGGRPALQARIQVLDSASTVVYGVQYGGGRYFYLKSNPGDSNYRLYVRQGLSGPERLLVTPGVSGNVHYSIDYFTPSPDGRYVAYGISAGGSENSVLHVVDSITARALPDSIDRAEYGNVSWRDDSRSFYYVRLQKMKPGMADVEKYRKSRVHLHFVGRDPEREPAVMGYGQSPLVPMTVDDSPVVSLFPGTRWAIGQVQHGVQNELTLYAAPVASLGLANIPWRKLADVPGAVTHFDVHGDDVYLLTHRGASRYKVVRENLESGASEVVVPASPRVVVSFGVARDALYVQDLDGGLARLRRLAWGQAAPTEVTLPFDGAVTELVTDVRLPGMVLRLAAWTHCPLWYRYDPHTGQLSDTRLRPAVPVDFSQVEAEEVMAPALDGTMIPLSIVHGKGITLDGSHPTLLNGYGSYGDSMAPAFDPTLLAWLERGGVYAMAHVRGGGEFGEDWHRAGMMLTKHNTWEDFEACARYLIANHYTDADHLSGEGTSAGGITIGRSITDHPELFGAALVRVGAVNTVRDEFTPNGPPNIPEFGTIATEAGFKGLYAMDAYQHVRDGVAYPAVMVTTGINDPRVASWEPAKLAARLQAASTGKPVLLRVDYDAGHGMGSTIVQRDAQKADEWAFLLWQLGDLDFQVEKGR